MWVIRPQAAAHHFRHQISAALRAILRRRGGEDLNSQRACNIRAISGLPRNMENPGFF
jgi:hypothetical protein